jgi:hypothetical protein
MEYRGCLKYSSALNIWRNRNMLRDILVGSKAAA